MRDEDSHLKHGAEIAAMARRAAKSRGYDFDGSSILCLWWRPCHVYWYHRGSVGGAQR